MAKNKPVPPAVTTDAAQLATAGFMPTGAEQFTRTVVEYANELFAQATRRGEVDRAAGARAEITHLHVRDAAHHLAGRSGKPKRSKWQIAGQVGEYVATAIAGAGASHLDKQSGVLTFGVALAVGVVLFVTRMSNSQE